MKTNLEQLTGNLPLYLKYDRQTQPQSAHIEIHANGNVFYETNAEIGNAVPVDVWHGKIRRITLPNFLTARGYQQLHDSISEDLELLINGMDERWDGSNWKGTLTDEANEVLERLQFASQNGEWDDFEHDEAALAELDA